jgi:hypothetical protein
VKTPTTGKIRPQATRTKGNKNLGQKDLPMVGVFTDHLKHRQKVNLAK